MPHARIHTFFALSLLVHAILAAIPLAQKRGEVSTIGVPMPMVVKLLESPKATEQPSPTLPEPVPAPKPRPEPLRREPRPAPPVVQPNPIPREVERPAVETVERRAEPQFDMLAMINARRQKREEQVEAVRRYEEAHSGTSAASAQGSQDAIKRNLQNMGSNGESTGGVFTILSKGTRRGEFAFNGWRPDTNRRWREVIEVDAGPGGDVELAIVRRMILLIRGHYSGDFIWRSHRLGKSLVLSARPEHTAELEEFLTREFFGTPTLAHQR